MKAKYLFLYLKTGGGHISTAKALERYFQKNNPDTEILMADGLEESPAFVKKIVVDGYSKAQTHGKWMYEFLYLCNKQYPIAKMYQLLMSFFTKSYIQKLIQNEKPSKIIVFHFFLVKPVKQALKELGLDTPIVVLVTDPFTGTRTWFMEKNMQYIVYSERMKKYAMNLGIAEKNIKVYSPIIHEKFLNKVDPAQISEIRKSHNIPPDKKVILLLGGGDGLPKGKKILQRLCKLGVKEQILIVCGRDKVLFNQAHKIKSANPEFALQIFEFIDFTHNLLNIADIVITKGGPATIFEILLCGKIPLIHTYMREQEKGNVEFVVDNKVGKYEKNIKKLTQIAKEILDGDLSTYQDEIKKLDLKIGTSEIAEYIRKM